jgi:hypothetical protein
MSGRGGNRPRTPGTVKEAVNTLFEQHGGRKWVESKLSLGHSQVAAYTDATAKDELPLSRAAMLTGRDTPALAEFFALLAHGVFLPIEPTECDLNKLCADNVREHSAAVADLVEAMSDRAVDRTEAAEALRLLRASIRIQVCLYVLLDQIAKGEGQ